QPGGGFAAEHDGDRTSVSRLPVFARDLLAVFVLDDPQRHAIFANDARTIGTDIDPAAIRVFGHDHVARANVAAAVVLMPLRRGKNTQIDALAFENILGDWPGRNFHGPVGFQIVSLIAPGFEDVQLRRIRWQT